MTDTAPGQLGLAARMRPIIEGVFKLYGINRPVTEADRLPRSEIQARRACCWIARQLLPYPQRQIAEVLGITERSVVHQDIAAFELLRERDPVVRRLTDQLLQELSSP